MGLDVLADLNLQLNQDASGLNKYEIARTILIRLNEFGDATLRERREIIKRVTEFENFSSCWPNDQLIAKGLVNEIRQVVNVKDSFTRMDLERETEQKKRQTQQKAKQEKESRRRDERLAIKGDLFALFKETDPQARGKSLEGILNRLFSTEDILISEALTLKGDDGEGIVAQIDGVVEINGAIYFVEMKWWSEPLGRGEVAKHIVNLFSRDGARGIFISNSGFSKPAIGDCRDALQHRVLILCTLEEIVLLLEKDDSLKNFLKAKIDAAIIHKNPFFEPLKIQQ